MRLNPVPGRLRALAGAAILAAITAFAPAMAQAAPKSELWPRWPALRK